MLQNGGTNFANVSVKEIVGEAIREKAPKIMLVHNHPSGDSRPSQMDIQFTNHLYQAAEMFEIDLLDHIIIGNLEYTSIYETIERKMKK